MAFNQIVKKVICLSTSDKQKTYSRTEAQLVQAKLFKYLIRRGKFTAFGEHYQFQAMLSSGNPVGWFNSTVPIHTYSDMYVRWWYRSLNGETYVTWPGKQKYFITKGNDNKSSGKYFPVSRAMISSFCNAGKQYLSAFGREIQPENENVGELNLKLDFNKVYYGGALAGIIAHHKPLKYHCCFSQLFVPGLSNSESGFMLTEVGWIGSKTDLLKDEYRLIVDNGVYYEFLPLTDNMFNDAGKLKDNHAATLSLDQLGNNIDYLLIITNNSGAWRYLSEHVIRFVDIKNLMFVIASKLKTGKK